MSEKNEIQWFQWMQDVREELKSMRENQHDKFIELSQSINKSAEEHTVIKEMIFKSKEEHNNRLAAIEKEFIIFKTKTQTRSAVISTVFSVFVSGIAVIWTLIQMSAKGN